MFTIDLQQSPDSSVLFILRGCGAACVCACEPQQLFHLVWKNIKKIIKKIDRTPSDSRPAEGTPTRRRCGRPPARPLCNSLALISGSIIVVIILNLFICLNGWAGWALCRREDGPLRKSPEFYACSTEGSLVLWVLHRSTVKHPRPTCSSCVRDTHTLPSAGHRLCLINTPEVSCRGPSCWCMSCPNF